MTEGTLALKSKRSAEEPVEIGQIVIGKDVLELVSSAMYVDSLTIYREYLQNAADAIDEARTKELYRIGERGRVDIDIDAEQRRVRIRDNGTGVRWQDFARRLTALGASAKRGGAARGFRGVGRLAGLGYAQRLIFRSRAHGENLVSQLVWDCRLLRSVLRSNEADFGVENLIRQSVTLSRISADGFPSRFFEVELDGVLRLRSDKLMNPTAIADYLAQVAPLPFAPDFPFAVPIFQALEPAVKLDTLELRISGLDTPVYRPHHRGFTDEKRKGSFEDVEIFTIPDVDGGQAAIGWLLHHEYDGAIPTGTGFKGVRLRIGNVQIGGNALLEELFVEPRFNSWTIGEVHVLDRRIVPNARRDDFEQNAHYSNLLNQLAPIARAVSKRCRTNSKRRQLLRDFDLQKEGIEERLQILAQGGIRKTARRAQALQIENALKRMARLANLPQLESEKTKLEGRIAKLQELARARIGSDASSPLDLVKPHKRAMYGQLIELIYECSANRIAAKALVDRILEKVSSEVPSAIKRPTTNRSKKINARNRPLKRTAAKKAPKSIREKSSKRRN
jgi:Histidine kinase-, DNA gyrase B-, and HSP90-like ATPase